MASTEQTHEKDVLIQNESDSKTTAVAESQQSDAEHQTTVEMIETGNEEKAETIDSTKLRRVASDEIDSSQSNLKGSDVIIDEDSSDSDDDEAAVAMMDDNYDNEWWREWLSFIYDETKSLLTPKVLQILYIILLGNSMIALIIVLASEEGGLDINWPWKVSKLNNWQFQLANVSLLFSYIPGNMLWLRMVLGVAGFWFMLWSARFPFGTLMDTFMWNYVMTLINLRHAIAIFYSKRPIIFDEAREQIYVNIFEGIMNRHDYKTLCKASLLRTLRKDRYYAHKGDACNNLAVIVSGRIQIVKTPKPVLMDISQMSKKNAPRRISIVETASEDIDANNSEPISLSPQNSSPKATHNRRRPSLTSATDDTLIATYLSDKLLWLEKNCFMDSPEFIMRHNRRGQRYQVGFQATEKCRYLMWPRESLIDLLQQNPHLNTPLMGALGIDVSKKLFATN